MRFHQMSFVVVLAAALSAAAPTWAQQGLHRGMAGHHYDAAAEVSLQGVVSRVAEVDCPGCGPGAGTHLTLKTDKESVEVLLGPAAYLAEQGFVVAEQDAIKVTGARIKTGDSTAILAREVTKGERTIVLRDKTGRPLWAGAGRRAR